MQRTRAPTNPRPSPPVTRPAASSAWPTSLFSTTTKRKGSSVPQNKAPASAGALLLILIVGVAYRSETERHSAAHRARRLHQIQRLAVAADHRNVAFRQQVPHVYQQLHMLRQEPDSRHRLPHEQAEERVRLSG